VAGVSADAAPPPDPWALLALRDAEYEATERAVEAAQLDRRRAWWARLEQRHVADASGIPRPVKVTP
jgi:hypothetical protein